MTQPFTKERIKRNTGPMLFSAPRKCSKCTMHKDRKGGKYVKTSRHRQDWVCADCVAKM